MTLRTRIALIAAAAVAVAFLAASTGLYINTARTLRASVDDSIIEMADELSRGGFRRPSPFGPRAGHLGGAGGFVQVVTADGRVLVPAGAPADPLPVSTVARDVATGHHGAFFETVSVDGEPVRILTWPGRRGAAIQVARPLGEVEDTLARLRQRLALAGLGGMVLAAVLGVVVANRAVRPVLELTDVAEDVAVTQDLSRRIAEERRDELGRLAQAFNTMLAALADARQAQEQLVADASHELRTPLTSLRTNIEVLADAGQLSAHERDELISEVTDQLDEFGQLVAALVELARGNQPVTTAAPVRLDEVAASAAARIVSRTGQVVELDLEPTVVVGEPDRLERAIANLLDNAVKYGARTIELHVADGEVRIRDHGPGLAPGDAERVFERFYRAPEARAAPGSGLGLAIARQIAVSHGGTLTAANAPDGGAVFTLRLPTAPA